MKLRIVDIAKILNVAPSTVSKALNNKPGVNRDLREKILKTAKQLGYEKDVLASYLRTRRTRMIGFIVPNVSNYFFGRLVLSIEKALYERGYQYFLFNSDEDEDRELEYVQSCLELGVEGLIVVTAARSNRRKLTQLYNRFILSNKPVIFIDRQLENINASCVVLDNAGAAWEAVEYLYKHGHKRIGAIVGPLGVYTAKERLEGFLKAIDMFGLKCKSEWIIKGEYSFDVAHQEVLDKFRRMSDYPSALVVFNNLMMMAALESFEQLRINVPEDISVVTFDDTPWHKFMRVPLTSIFQPVEEMGTIAANILFNELSDPNRKKGKVILKGQLIERASVKSILPT